ncbi:MAG TPA: hypothetical protein ENK66_11315, partial [Arcobacter sp.]|nr:hypothetical protein [Arcobacter sp.]
LAIIVFSSIREQLELVNIPKGMQGVPISLLVAGLLSLAFMGFVGMVSLKIITYPILRWIH